MLAQAADVTWFFKTYSIRSTFDATNVNSGLFRYMIL